MFFNVFCNANSFKRDTYTAILFCEMTPPPTKKKIFLAKKKYMLKSFRIKIAKIFVIIVSDFSNNQF